MYLFSQHLQLDSLSQDFNEDLETGLKASILSRVGDYDFFEASQQMENTFNFYESIASFDINHLRICLLNNFCILISQKAFCFN